MAKKLTAVLLCMLLVLSLAACKVNTAEPVDSNTSNPSFSESESVAESSSAQTTQPAETTSKATEINKNPVSTTETTAATTTNKATTTKKEITTKKETATKGVTTTAKKVTTTKKITTTKKAASTTTTQAASKPNYTVNSSNSDIRGVYNLVNQQRANSGVSKLEYRNDLQSAANTRAKELATNFSHTRPNGSACFTAINVSYKTAVENIAYGSDDVSGTMNQWMNSKNHRENILSTKYTGIAVGCYEKDGVKYWVQLFVG